MSPERNGSSGSAASHDPGLLLELAVELARPPSPRSRRRRAAAGATRSRRQGRASRASRPRACPPRRAARSRRGRRRTPGRPARRGRRRRRRRAGRRAPARRPRRASRSRGRARPPSRHRACAPAPARRCGGSSRTATGPRSAGVHAGCPAQDWILAGRRASMHQRLEPAIRRPPISATAEACRSERSAPAPETRAPTNEYMAISPGRTTSRRVNAVSSSSAPAAASRKKTTGNAMPAMTAAMSARARLSAGLTLRCPRTCSPIDLAVELGQPHGDACSQQSRYRRRRPAADAPRAPRRARAR